MSKHSLGGPFKFFQKRRIRALQTKLNKVKGNVCELEKKVKVEKEKASILFTVSEYDNLIGDLDDALEATCDCAKSAASKPSREATVDLAAEMEKQCKEDLHKAGKIKRASGSGRVSKEDKKLINDCIESKKGGSALGSCRVRRRRR